MPRGEQAMKMEGSFGMRQYERLGRKTKCIISKWLLVLFFLKVGFELQTFILKLTGQKCDHKVIV